MTRVPVDVRREQLVAAAIRVMTREGIARTTTRAVVAEAGMPLGAFRSCFRSKRELLQHVIEAITEHILAVALDVLQGQGTLTDRLRVGLRAYWEDMVRNPDHHRLTYELTQYAVGQPGLADVARRQYETYLRAFTTLLETLAEAAQVAWRPPLPALTRYLAAEIDGLTLLYLIERDAETAWSALELLADHVASLASPTGDPAG